VLDEVLKSQLAADPTLATRMNQIESFTQNAMLTGRLVNGKVEIPVVVNVLYVPLQKTLMHKFNHKLTC
jgi:hypothetical protein